MNNLINRFTKSYDVVIKDINVFGKEYIPDNLPYREGLSNDIVDAMRTKTNIILAGQPSSGKTVTIKRIFKQFTDASANNDDPSNKMLTNMRFIYVSCKGQTASSVYTSILGKLGVQTSSRGFSIAHYQQLLDKELIRRNIAHTYICLDEYDYIAYKYSGFDNILYYFVNLDNYTLIIIVNDHEVVGDNLDIKTDDRLDAKIIYLDNYTIDEIYGILNERVNLGLEKDIFTEEELCNLSRITYDHIRRLRIGISSIPRMVEVRESLDRPLEYNEIKAIMNKEKDKDRVKTYLTLPPKEKFIIEIIIQIMKDKKKTNKYISPTVDNILRYWNTNCRDGGISEISEKTVRRYLRRLEQRKVIKKKRDSYKVGRPKNIYHPNFDVGIYTILVDKNNNKHTE